MLKKIGSTGLSWLWLAVLLMAIDRFSKIWVVNNLSFFHPYEILPFFNLTLAYNTGAAFSFLHSASGWQNWLFGAFAAVVSVAVIIWLARLSAKAYWTCIALCLVLTGALGNAWDRFFYGYVIDFLDFHLGDWHFAIFNIADSAIFIGAIMLCWKWLKTSPEPSSTL